MMCNKYSCQGKYTGRLVTAPIWKIWVNQTGNTKNQLAQSINAAPAASVR